MFYVFIWLGHMVTGGNFSVGGNGQVRVYRRHQGRYVDLRSAGVGCHVKFFHSFSLLNRLARFFSAT